MDTFIVRFYRRQPRSPQDVVGTVERVGSGERSGFAGREELLEHLLAPPPGADTRSDPNSTRSSRPLTP
jgi:hypothetical protein